VISSPLVVHRHPDDLPDVGTSLSLAG